MCVKIKEKDAVWGWHVVLQRPGENCPMIANRPKKEKKSNYVVKPGYVYRETSKSIKICRRGLHFSTTVGDAMYWADCICGFEKYNEVQMSSVRIFLCRVRAWGKIECSWQSDEKKVARYREVVEMKELPRKFFDYIGCTLCDYQKNTDFWDFVKTFKSWNK